LAAAIIEQATFGPELGTGTGHTLTQTGGIAYGLGLGTPAAAKPANRIGPAHALSANRQAIVLATGLIGTKASGTIFESAPIQATVAADLTLPNPALTAFGGSRGLTSMGTGQTYVLHGIAAFPAMDLLETV